MKPQKNSKIPQILAKPTDVSIGEEISMRLQSLANRAAEVEEFAYEKLKPISMDKIYPECGEILEEEYPELFAKMRESIKIIEDRLEVIQQRISNVTI